MIAESDADLEKNSYEVVIDAVGIDPTRATASRIVRPGGVVAHIGLGSGNGGLDVRKFTLQEVTFVGAYTYTMQDFAETLALLEARALGDLTWVGTAHPRRRPCGIP